MYYNITYYWSQPVLIVLTIMVATLLLVLCEMSKMRKVKVDIQLVTVIVNLLSCPVFQTSQLLYCILRAANCDLAKASLPEDTHEYLGKFCG